MKQIMQIYIFDSEKNSITGYRLPFTVFSVCSLPVISLIPETTTFSAPAQFRRVQDFYISSDIALTCPISLATRIQWTIYNCTSSCSNLLQIDPSVSTTFSELFIPARTLDFGLYELKITVTMQAVPQLTSSASAFVRINPSGITANLVPLGTSIITSGHQKNLTLDPGAYSVDPDAQAFNASVSHHALGTNETCSLSCLELELCLLLSTL